MSSRKLLPLQDVDGVQTGYVIGDRSTQTTREFNTDQMTDWRKK